MGKLWISISVEHLSFKFQFPVLISLLLPLGWSLLLELMAYSIPILHEILDVSFKANG